MGQSDSNSSININLKNQENKYKNLFKNQKEMSYHEFEIIYKKSDVVKIFDIIFINNNKEKCKIIYKD